MLPTYLQDLRAARTDQTRFSRAEMVMRILFMPTTCSSKHHVWRRQDSLSRFLLKQETQTPNDLMIPYGERKPGSDGLSSWYPVIENQIWRRERSREMCISRLQDAMNAIARRKQRQHQPIPGKLPLYKNLEKIPIRLGSLKSQVYLMIGSIDRTVLLGWQQHNKRRGSFLIHITIRQPNEGRW